MVTKLGKRSRVYYFDYELTELFDREELENKLALARRHIIAVFHNATFTHRGRRRGTDNFIVGVDKRQKDLAKHIATSAKRFVDVRDLPVEISHLTDGHRNHIAGQAQYKLVLAMLNQMCGPGSQHEIYWDDMRGWWQMRASCLTEYLSVNHARRQLKRDDRTFHGRVRSQSKRRGVPEGASISYAQGSIAV